MQLIINDSDGKSYKMEVPKEKEALFIGKKVGSKIEGIFLGLEGYVLEITGGSDKTGTPIRPSLEGSEKRYVLISEGPGIRKRKKTKGLRLRKSVRGKQISQDIVQVNSKVIQKGTKPLSELFPKTEKKE